MSDAFRVRPFREGDETEVAALWLRVFPDARAANAPREDIRRKLAIQPDLFLVGDLGGVVVGTVMAGYDGHRGWIYRLAVATECRGRGFAREFMTEAEAQLRKVGCPKINLQVRGGNREVVSFYEELGFAVEDRVSMGKRLI